MGGGHGARDRRDSTTELGAGWGSTNYEQLDLATLARIVMRGNPARVSEVGHGWERVGRLLHEGADQLETHLAELASKWTGSAFAQYRTMVLDVVAATRIVARTALTLRDEVLANAEALAEAQRRIAGLPADATSTTVVSGAWGTATVSSPRPVSFDVKVS